MSLSIWAIIILVGIVGWQFEKRLDKRDARIDELEDDIGSIKNFVGLTPEIERIVIENERDLRMAELDDKLIDDKL